MENIKTHNLVPFNLFFVAYKYAPLLISGKVANNNISVAMDRKEIEGRAFRFSHKGRQKLNKIMLYNSHNIECAKYTSNARPETQGVFFSKNKTVATDSFRLLEVSTPQGIDPANYPQAMRGCSPFIADAAVVKKLKIGKQGIPELNHVAIKHVDDQKIEFLVAEEPNSPVATVKTAMRIDAKFPDYENIFPKEEPKARFTINAQYLGEMLMSMAKLNNQVTVYFYEENKPIKIEGEKNGQKMRALVMPVRT